VTSPLRRMALTVGMVLLALIVLGGALTAVAAATRMRAEQQHAYDLSGSRLGVDADSGAIRITAGPTGRVEVDTHLHHSQLNRAEPTARLEGDRLLLRDGCRRFLNFSCDVSYDLRVPATVALQLRVQTSNGSISATDLHAGIVDASNANGGVALAFVAAPQRVAARASNGSVTVTVPRDGGPYRVDARTANGRSTVDVPTDPDASSTITARADS
jgi:Putative adhesin